MRALFSGLASRTNHRWSVPAEPVLAPAAGSRGVTRPSADLSIRELTKVYGANKVVDEVSVGVQGGEVLTLLGPSGCGKTTLLKMIAGLVDPTSGDVRVDGRSLQGVPSHKRHFGMLFQNYALFPHLDVLSNVAFGLEMRRVSRSEIAPLCRKALDRVELAAFAERMPHELSGGQQQRVALARALVYEPRVLLLDEPFGALDKKLREGMQLELRALCTQLDLTTVLVTHDQDEALTLADRVAVMRGGCIEQIGPARDVYERPRSRFVADFIGTSNFFAGTITGRCGNRVQLKTPEGMALVAEAPEPEAHERDATVAVRPEAILLSTQEKGAAANSLAGVVRQVVFRGASMTTILSIAGGGDLVCSTATGHESKSPAVGETWWASWSAEKAILVRDL